MIHRMFKNTIKQFLYVTLHEKANAINILGKYVYCAGGSIARNSGAVNKKLTIQGECVKKQRGKEQKNQAQTRMWHRGYA
jgi:ABC-type iron transport system FetAB ATPase subunit